MSLDHHARTLKTLSASARRVSRLAASYSRRHVQTITRSRALLATDPEAFDVEVPKYDFKTDKLLTTVLKDNFVTSNLPTTCASLTLEGFDAPHQSTVARLLEDAGVRILAKTNMDEFGMGSHSVNSAYGSVKNGPGDDAQSAGGSSGGSAMAVADGVVHVAVGSDTGGSVRLPAAYTGTVGFKPSYGRISRNGLVPYANSLDTVGIIANDVRNARRLYKILTRSDPADPTCQTRSMRQRINDLLNRRDLQPRGAGKRSEGASIRVIPQDGRGSSYVARTRYSRLEQPTAMRKPYRRIGVPDEYNIEEMHPLVRQAWARTLSLLSDLGHKIVPISLPTTQQALSAYYVLAPAEASSNLAKYDGVRYGTPRPSEHHDNHDGPLYSHYRGLFFGDEVQRRILLGTFSLSAGAMDNYFIQAQKVRRLVQQDFNKVFALPNPLENHSYDSRTNPDPNLVDLILVPTAPTPPPLLSEVSKQSPLDSYVNDVFTVPASLAGLPAVSVPVIADDDLPAIPERSVGMQVIGQYGDDLDVLDFARTAIEANMDIPARSGTRTLTRTRL